MLRENDDYVSNSMAGKSSSGDGFLRTFPYGLDIQVFRRSLLDRLATVTDPFYQEFPEDYLRDHASDIRIGELRHHADDSDIYVTVDYAQDLEVVRRIYERLYRPDAAFGFGEIVTLLRQHPELDTREGSLARNIEYVARKQERQGA
jgi:spore coat polysaccharide biosynthesis protein SpsF (cytidylyltransferase family)